MRRRHALLLAAIVALALITWLRIHLVNGLPDQGYFAKYLTFADRILAGSIPRDRLGDLSPAYLWTIVLLRRLGFGVRAIRDLQMASLSIAAALCGIAAARIGGRWAGVAAVLLVLLNRGALIAATEIEPETLIVVALAASLAALMMWEHDRRPWMVAIAGLFLGIAVTGRPVAALALLLVTVRIFVRVRRHLAPFLIAAAVPVAIVLAVNGNLTGHVSIMEPGTGLYDGNNPLATGCAGVLPRIVADLDAASTEPDYLHVAYRIVAARANASEGNRYWSRKSLAWMRTYPAAAIRLFATKALLSVHNYDVFDLATMWQKNEELPRWPFVPFGALTALTFAALLLRRPRASLAPILIFAVATIAALIIFNVSVRQRDALLPPLAVLAAVGIVEIFRCRGQRLAIACGAVLSVTLLLGIDGNAQREDAYAWEASHQAQRAAATGRYAMASVLRTAWPPSVTAEGLRMSAMQAVAATSRPEVLFDAAIALEKADAWREADGVLATLDDYTPRRDNRAVSSVAYYRARAARHLGRDPRALLDQAERDAPGDPDVLAARAVAGDAAAAQRLNLLHDPFTRDYALARARDDAGDHAGARALRDRLLRAFPEWRRSAELR
jgi:4-amino-4-deoxy-L-arabinose transferase-like glycosyltransferase